MAAKRILDASPLILFSKVGRLDLLRIGADKVIVPDAVLEEIGVKGEADLTFRAIADNDWLDAAPAVEVPELVAGFRLGRGETAVLALAHDDPECEASLDDLAARRAAVALGLHCIGTLGLVLLGKRNGVIPVARPTIEELRRCGLFLDDDFVAEVLKRVGE